jgi:hypothetical protein
MCFRIAFLILLLLFSCTFAIAEDQWKEYSSFMDRFYYLDKQDFNSISCEIYLPTFNNLLSQTKEQLKNMTDAIEITENISDFRLIVNKKSGLTFIKPSIDIKIISEEKIKDRNKLELGNEYLRQGFRSQIEGAIQMIEGLFGTYISPKRDLLKIKQISRNNNEFKVVYEINNYHNTEIYSENRGSSEQISNRVKTLTKSEFQAIDDKLITKSADIHIDDSVSTQDVKITIDYQKINTIILPSKIVTQSKIALSASHMEGQNEIFLRNCKID